MKKLIILIVRPIVMLYVLYLWKLYLSRMKKWQYQQSNMNIARQRFLKAKLLYWQSSFSSWGTMELGKFSYSLESHDKYQRRLKKLNFHGGFEYMEWNSLSQGKYPQRLSDRVTKI